MEIENTVSGSSQGELLIGDAGQPTSTWPDWPVNPESHTDPAVRSERWLPAGGDGHLRPVPFSTGTFNRHFSPTGDDTGK